MRKHHHAQSERSKRLERFNPFLFVSEDNELWYRRSPKLSIVLRTSLLVLKTSSLAPLQYHLTIVLSLPRCNFKETLSNFITVACVV